MQPDDETYRQRLHRDVRSNLAAGLAILCGLIALGGLGLVILPGPQSAARQNSTFWLLVIPAAWWVASLVWFEGWAVRLIRPVFMLAPLLCAVGALWAVTLGRNPLVHLGAGGIAIVLAIAGWRTYGSSLLHRDGPAS